MKKYAVDTDSHPKDEMKLAEQRGTCPLCGAKLVEDSRVLVCPNCGSEPFEEPVSD